MTFHVITLFPRAFDSYLGESILKRAIEDKKIKVKFYNPRDFTLDKHKRIDRAPYGGGPGMVIQAEPVIKAVEAALRDLRCKIKDLRKKKLNAKRYTLNAKVIWLTPGGKQFTNETGVKFAKHTDIIIICGRYEGIDARVKKVLNTTRIYESKERMTRIRIEEISVGPFVLTGGELPAMLMIDVISRQVKGVLGDFNSLEEIRIASPDVYTRPEIFEWNDRKYKVPRVLLSGHHANIEKWKKIKLSRRAR